MIDVRSIGEKCLRDEADAILGIISLLDENFDKAILLILDCKGKVIVTGVGKSGHIGNKIAATLSSTGTPAFFLNPLDAFHGDLGMISDNDIIMMISYSGNTDEMVRLLPFIKHHKLPVISITGNCDSILAKNSVSHICTSVDHEACPLNLAPTSSTTAALALGDALACALIKVRQFSANDFAEFHPGGSLGRRLLTKASDVMQRENLPIISPNMHLEEAILHISEGKFGLCVIVDNDQILGIVTDGDIHRAMQDLRDKFFETTVQDIMTRNPKSVNPDMNIALVQKIMIDSKIHTILVVDDKQNLLGLIDSNSCRV